PRRGAYLRSRRKRKRLSSLKRLSSVMLLTAFALKTPTMSVIASRVENRRSGFSLAVACGLGFVDFCVAPEIVEELLRGCVGIGDLHYPVQVVVIVVRRSLQ